MTEQLNTGDLTKDGLILTYGKLHLLHSDYRVKSADINKKYPAEISKKLPCFVMK